MIFENVLVCGKFKGSYVKVAVARENYLRHLPIRSLKWDVIHIGKYTCREVARVLVEAEDTSIEIKIGYYDMFSFWKTEVKIKVPLRDMVPGRVVNCTYMGGVTKVEGDLNP